MPDNKSPDQAAETQASQTAPPSISLPKGGGAIRGIGEKFAANPVTGTGSMTVPIATSPGRSGFGPQLALSYDSGAGNGPFGFGWSLSLPSITRKTDKGLPRYWDADESDVFILSGAEDLVPVMVKSGEQWVRQKIKPRIVDGQTYNIYRYRPRIEGLFARIERWTNQTDPEDVFWRSISRDNVTTWYGKTAESRIADPADSTRIFSWLICETHDDKGNVMVYTYVEEDSVNVDAPNDPKIHERNRSDTSRSAQRYLKKIRYGNHTPYLPKLVDADMWPVPPGADDPDASPEWLFEVVFDYGEHDENTPMPNDHDHNEWFPRPDPFSSYRAGFEIRTYRLCQRVLMFHHFPEEDIGADCLVRSTDFTYRYEQDAADPRNPIYSFLVSVSQSGYKRQNSGYLKRSLPPLEFEYSRVNLGEAAVEVDAESLENLPVGLGSGQYQWMDLDGVGMSGILTEQAEGWYYKRNLSPITVKKDLDGETVVARFAPVELVSQQPSLADVGNGRQQFLDLAGDGQLDLVALAGPISGFYERTLEQGWANFRSFPKMPNIPWDDPNLRLVDLTGDGHADIFITQDEIITWYPSLGEDGFGLAEKVYQALDEEKGPHLVFADGSQSIQLADLSGDGLSDLVRIRNGEVCYWSNLGYGRFGAKVTMDNAPWFDSPDQFDQRRIRLADIDGSGTTDIIYLGRDGVHIYYNQSGNSWSDAVILVNFPQIDNLSAVQALDLLGNGTACLVWSSPLPNGTGCPMRYIDLMGGQKPHLLVKTVNNLGAETEVQYAPSTKFYLNDNNEGKPWITRLPFPVHCVEKVTVTDKWRNTRFSTRYSYHHGYFDGIEREFRGFGRVEQIDVETFGEFAEGNAASPYITDDQTLYQPPVKTVTWFHTGACVDQERILTQFREEYFPYWLVDAGLSIDPDYIFAERALPEPDLMNLDLGNEEWHEAIRACKGMTLRQEAYELDVDALETGQHVPVKLFSAACHNCRIQRLQPRAGNPHAVFLVTEAEVLTYHYELDLKEHILRPDPRIAHALTLSSNEYGQPQQVVAVGYPRARPFQETEQDNLLEGTAALIRSVQKELHLSYTESHYTNTVEVDDHYRLQLPCEVFTYELTGIRPADEGDRATTDPWDDVYFTLDELRAYRLSDLYQANGLPVETIAYQQLPDRANPQKRIVERVRSLYFSDNLNDSLPLGKLNHLGLLYETYTLALTDDLIDAILKEKLETVQENGEDYDATVQRILRSGGYHLWDDLWWTRSGIAGFADDAAQHFYLPECYTDPFSNETTLNFDPYDLYIKSSTDPVGNTVSVEQFDFRVLAPTEMMDMNDNHTEVWFDALGMVVASAVKGEQIGGFWQGDNLNGFTDELANPPGTAVADFCTGSILDESQARAWLGNAGARYVYHFGERIDAEGKMIWNDRMAGACGIVREKHVGQLEAGEASPLQVYLECSDGTGNVLMKKVQAEPDPSLAMASAPLRWIVNGLTVLNNKGKPVKQYEPAITPDFGCELPRASGVTPVMYYDAAGRLIRTEQPDGAYSRVEFCPWLTATFDPNDTVLEPDNAWYARSSATNAEAETRRAAQLAANHAETPAVIHLDSLGREVLAVAHNRYPDSAGTWVDKKYVTFTKLDAEGKPLWIRDDRGNRVMQYITPPISDGQPDDPLDGYFPCYDIAGNLLYQHSMDAGDRWMLNDVTGQPLYAWDSRDNLLHTTYDALRRPKKLELRNDDHSDWIVVGYTQYGDDMIFDNEDEYFKSLNRRGQAFLSYDQSGLITTEHFDFKGNPLVVHRRLAVAFDGEINWQSAENLPPDREPDRLLMAESFNQTSEYDALNRITRQYTWHKGVGSRVNVFEPYYNERGLLKKEDLWLEANKTVTGSENGSKTEVIKELTYNAKGQRESITYGNGATTSYTYDENTFRLIHLQTLRNRDGKRLQDLHYTYDPIGNFTEIIDNAQPPVFFNNFQIDAKNQYIYDALYRLIEARGREHAGQVIHDPYDNWHDCFFRKHYHRNDAMAWQKYTERYNYDAVGNILSVKHTSQGNGSNNWTRHFQYAQHSNRLLATGIGDAPTETYPGTPTLEYPYQYNQHGSMTAMPHLTTMEWNFTEHLHHTVRQAGTIGENEDACPNNSIEAWYRYDAAKQRSRKRVAKNQGGIVEERLYLGRFEIFRRTDGTGRVLLERETLHIMDDQQRIALVETKNIDTANTGALIDPVIRYQLGNHLGSASLELDWDGAVISYEEYHPYGTTSYQAGRSAAEISLKRYRYTGKERDEETGFNYHGARYYAGWLGRWVSCDENGIITGINLYQYVKGNGINLRDSNGKQEELPWYNQIGVAVTEGARQVSQRVEGLAHIVEDPISTVHETGKQVYNRYQVHTAGPLAETGPSAAVHALSDVLNPLAEAKRQSDRAHRAERSGDEVDAIQAKVAEFASLLDALTTFVGPSILKNRIGKSLKKAPTATASPPAPGSYPEAPLPRFELPEEAPILPKSQSPGDALLLTVGGVPGQCQLGTAAILEGTGAEIQSVFQRTGLTRHQLPYGESGLVIYDELGLNRGSMLQPRSTVELYSMMRTFPEGTNFQVLWVNPGGKSSHAVAGLLGSRGEIMFIETTISPMQLTIPPIASFNFRLTPVTPRMR